MHPIHDHDPLLFLAVALAAKRRPAELVDVVAAIDLLQIAIPGEQRFIDSFARLAEAGLLLGRDDGLALSAQLGEDHIRALFDTVEWQPRGTGHYALLHKTKQEWNGPVQAWSLVEHLQAPGFAEFRHLLARDSGLGIDCGVPHATLYVAGDPYGIGLPDLVAYRACFVRDVPASEVMGDPVIGP